MQFLKWHQKLGALFFILLTSSVSASTVTEDLFGDVLVGAFVGETGVGTFSYDNDLITGVGFESLSSDDFSLELTIFGKTFGNADDFDFPNTPELNFFDGLAIELDFLVIGGIPTVGVNDFSVFDLSLTSSGKFETEVMVNTVVPIPFSAWLFASGLLGLMGYNRKRKPTFY